MKIVVVGGTGLVGRKLVAALEDEGHTAVAASPSTGVDTWTGAGPAEALEGAAVVVDVPEANSASATATGSLTGIRCVCLRTCGHQVHIWSMHGKGQWRRAGRPDLDQ
jgi:glutamate dehydrogenase/leucine dehydrogenase